MDTTKLTPAELHALKHVSKAADKCRAQLKPGTVELDFGVHLTGRLIVGEPSSFSQSSAPTAVDLVAALLSQFGPRKRVAIADKLIEQGLAATIVDGEQTRPLAESVINALTTRALVQRNGNVTGEFEVVPVKIG